MGWTRRVERKYVLKLVFPRRDMERLSWLFKMFKSGGIKPVRVCTVALFEARSDLDMIEAVYVIELEKGEYLRLRQDLAKSLSRTIGFFLLYRYDESSPFGRI